MDDGSRVQILERFGELVDDEANVHVLEYSLGDDVMQIRFHELKKQINVLIVVSAHALE